MAMARMSRRTALGAGLSAVGVAAVARSVRAADYPSRPITMICPWAAGGGTDATSRIVGSLLEKELGKPVNVVNRTGGSGVVGHRRSRRRHRTATRSASSPSRSG